MTLTAGARLGPYEVVELLGAGGMGAVYRAKDPRLGREVAIKVLPEDVASAPERLHRFEQEARAVGALNHPHILTVYDVGTQDGTPYVVTELLEGETLREVLLRRTPTTRQVLAWGVQAAQGLSAAHRKGIVHRDVKPENVFLTSDGRIKILDFGLAKLTQVDEKPPQTQASTAAGGTQPGVVLGTVAYMSPEQVRAEGVDPRSDLFSLGVVLYELLCGENPFWRASVPATLTAILHEEAPALCSRQAGVSPAVERIVGRCLQKGREERFQSAHDLALALEAVLEGGSAATTLLEVEERSPYPGLSSFTEEDASHFFGREQEIRDLWEKLRGRRLLAVIGPSGAGKTSFVRAGVVASRPEGWAAIVSTPGTAPLRALGQALGPELSGDPEALRKLAGFEDPETAFELLARWRRSTDEALVVIDQFEELFTLNAPQTQAQFAALLERLTGEADVHVLLSLRDDFLMRCHDHAPLGPVFGELTPLGAMTREGMRRAMLEPALKQGYRFEEDALVDEMVGTVEGARAALPLLAFAVSRLWERRDREKKLLTREAYREIGGVEGALAQHAEATYERIGPEREGIVREMFRNLTTAQGTRAVLDREELLSALPDRAAGERVLQHLVDARLLTSYETEGGEGEPARHRVEIVHESLLKAWPRLVRWQTQHADGAQLRDQLRQAAHLWEERGKTEDLLWTGASFLDFRAWRERYPGGLSAVEEDFAKSMASVADRKRRRRRIAVAVIVAALAVGLGVVAALWRRSTAQARRAEAAKLLAIGQERLAEDPTEALAFTTASLELADSREARLFALKALWDSPPALELTIGGPVWLPRFSPDGRQLAVGGYMSDSHVFPEDGGAPRVLPGRSGIPHWVSGRLVLDEDRRGSVWSLPDLRLERIVEFGGVSLVSPIGSRLFLKTEIGGKEGRPAEYALRSWAPEEEAPVELGHVSPGGVQAWGPGGTSWLYARGATLLARALPISPRSPDTVLGEHAPEIAGIRPFGNEVITFNRAREMRLWTFEPGKPPRVEDFPTPAGADPPLALSGRWMFRTIEQGAALWKRGSWSAARPLVLRRNVSWWSTRMSMHPSDDWLVASTETYNRLTFWPIRTPRPLVVEGFRHEQKILAFSPDGRWLASSWPGGNIRLWPLTPGATTPRTLAVPGMRGDEPNNFAFDPGGRFLFCVGIRTLWIVPLDGRPPFELEGFTNVPWMWAAAVSPSGRFVATARDTGIGDDALRVWDLDKGTTFAFDLPRQGVCADRTVGIGSLAFDGESTLYSAGSAGCGGIRRWDLGSGRQEAVIENIGEGHLALIRPDIGIALTRQPGASIVVHDLARHTSRELPQFGNSGSFQLDPSGRVLVTGDSDGIRVGRLSGGEPHLLLGHKGGVGAVGGIGGLAVSPDLKWIASGGGDSTLRLWPMPDFDKPPLHTLPQAELVAKLKSLTNLRAVRDAKAPSGWKIDLGPFPGWKNVPTW